MLTPRCVTEEKNCNSRCNSFFLRRADEKHGTNENARHFQLHSTSNLHDLFKMLTANYLAF